MACGTKSLADSSTGGSDPYGLNVESKTGKDSCQMELQESEVLALPAAGPCCSNPSGSQSQRVTYVHAKEKQQRKNHAAAKSGPRGIRTLDLSDANRTLSQLSYRPIFVFQNENSVTLLEGFVKDFSPGRPAGNGRLDRTRRFLKNGRSFRENNSGFRRKSVLQ